MKASTHQREQRRPAWKTLLAFGIIYFVWGSTFLAIRVGVREVPPFLLAAMRFLAERGVAVLGSDGNNDTAPSSTEGVDFPIHVLAICAMGVHLFDYLQFEDVRRVCERSGRWEFLFTAAPLRIVNGTGSPLNPVAVF